VSPREPDLIQHLLFIDDEQGKRTITLEAATCTIGRDLSNSIVIYSHAVSRHHATLLRVTQPETTMHLFRIIDGNLQGRRSRNGLYVNDERCFSHDLKHGDIINFGGDIKAKYYAANNLVDINFLISCEAEDVSGFLSSLKDPFDTLVTGDNELRDANESAMLRLASFPELNPNPSLEIDLNGTITYLNPAAVLQFPDIRVTQLQHPALVNIISTVQGRETNVFVREVEVAGKTYEQAIHHIPESDLIRIYSIDITERQQARLSLQQAHDELGIKVEESAIELKKTNEKLQSEIAERRRVEEALRNSFSTNRALLDAIPDWMFRIRGDGVFVNSKAPKGSDLPMPTHDFLSKNLTEVLPTEIAQAFKLCVGKALATREMQILEYQLSLNHKLLDYEVRFAVSAEYEVMAIVRDITERKQVEADIRKALEKEKELSEIKSDFITLTSHEFRTPLATILSSAELLEHYSHKWSDEKKLTHLQRIQTAVQYMTGLLNDVLLIGKAESGNLKCELKPLNLVEFCQGLTSETQLANCTHTIIFRANVQNLLVSMDEKLLRYIFSNLLSNAIKYSPQGSTINFELNYNPENATFSVQDEGIGIPLADQEKVFNTFCRASNAGTIPGVGLGLSIVKKSVDLFKGDIVCESELNVGTTFTVKLPLT
jgi:signal transduction histidine kinase/pSer/pThr/pTyr-binding forkhead associated (FHA) protein